MISSAITYVQNTDIKTALMMTGAASWMSQQQEASLNWSLADFESRVIKPISTKKSQLFVMNEADPIAFLSWTFVNEASHQKLCEDRLFPYDLEEQGEGKFLWLVSCLMVPGLEKLVSRSVAHNFFEKGTDVFWKNRKGDVQKIVSARSNPFSFVGNWP